MRFDTAPSYGLGTAEQVLGRALAGMAQVRISTKCGSSAPSLPYLRTCARAVKNLVAPHQRQRGLPRDYIPLTTIPRPRGGRFDVAEMSRVFRQSQESLRRDSVDQLLLHESYAIDDMIGAGDWLIGRRTAGAVKSGVGYANSGVYDDARDPAFPADFIFQTALPPDWLETGFPVLSRTGNFHSIAKSLSYVRARSTRFVQRLERVVKIVEGCGADLTSVEIAVLFAIANAALPTAGLIFSSIDHVRLSSFLRAVDFIDAEVGTAKVARVFWRSNQ